VLHTSEDLKETFIHYMERGAAAERFFSDQEAFQRIARAAAEYPGAKVAYTCTHARTHARIHTCTHTETEIHFSGVTGGQAGFHFGSQKRVFA
jgi:hypothetical protein